MGVVRIVTVTPLSKAEQSKLEAAWNKKSGGGDTFAYETDVNLIGGIRIEKGAQIYDASVKGQLAKLRKSL